MADFFRKDFTQDGPRRQAMKNAFHLMSKQKFYESAAIFLLANSLHDAVMVGVCEKHIDLLSDYVHLYVHMFLSVCQNNNSVDC